MVVKRDDSIDKLNLSIESHNILTDMGILTVGELLDFPSSKFITTKELEWKNFLEVKQVLRKINMGEIVISDEDFLSYRDPYSQTLNNVQVMEDSVEVFNFTFPPKQIIVVKNESPLESETQECEFEVPVVEEDQPEDSELPLESETQKCEFEVPVVEEDKPEDSELPLESETQECEFEVPVVEEEHPEGYSLRCSDSIDKLNISVRAYNALTREGIMNVDDFLNYPKDLFCNLRNVGSKTVSEIEDLLYKFGVSEILAVDSNELQTCLLKVDDSVKKLNLSVRAYNALTQSGIITIGDLLSYPIRNFSSIRNLGKKTLFEIREILHKIRINEIVVCDKDSMLNSNFSHNIKYIKSFIYIDGVRYIDKSIEELGFGKKYLKCLQNNGFNYLSEIILKNKRDFHSIPRMSNKSALEIVEKLKNFELEPLKEEGSEYITAEQLCYSVFSQLSEKMSLNGVEHHKALIDLLSNYIDKYDKATDSNMFLSDLDFRNKIQAVPYIKKQFQKYLIEILENYIYGCSLDDLYSELPSLLKSMDYLNNNVHILLDTGDIAQVKDGQYIRNYPTVSDGAKNILSDERQYDIFIQRTEGKTLDELGQLFNITKERVRQIEGKALKKLDKHGVIFKEDIYSDMYQRYSMKAEDFHIAFNNTQAYYYLSLRYKNPKENIKKNLADILEDNAIPKSFRRSVEKAVYKDYVIIDSEYVLCNRAELVNYTLRNFALDEITLDDFQSTYAMILEEIGQEDSEKLRLDDRYDVARHENVLWKFGKKLRYYNMKDYDFVDFCTTLNLNQYKNVEYSTLKFFSIYPELMREYDIRDEYELHNLLKKIWTKDICANISFNRMPNIEFGVANRHAQVEELLLLLAPISQEAFAVEYEKEYGVLARTFLGSSYLKDFDIYLYDGIYTLDKPTLPSDISSQLALLLTDDFYLISDIKQLYSKEFPESDPALLNQGSFKNLGFKVYSSYVICDKFSSSTDYFNNLLTKDDIIDTSVFPAGVKRVGAYTSQLYKLKSDYSIIEFYPNKYVSYNRLYEHRITKDKLNDFVQEVFDTLRSGQYFTMYSLREDGFEHQLEDIGFEDLFYISLLVERKDLFSSFKIKGSRVFIKERKEGSFINLIEQIIFNQKKLFMDQYDLQNEFKKYYGIIVPIEKIIGAVQDSNMYYDAISKTVYADYDLFWEEI